MRKLAGFKVKIPLTINAISRAIVDAEVSRLRNSVIAIVAPDKKGRPYVTGSALLIEYEGRKIVATAEHVLSDNAKDGITNLFFFGSDCHARPFSGGFETSSSEYDLAARALLPDEIASLSHLPLLKESDLGCVVPAGTRFYATVIGFPATASKLIDNVTIETEMEAFSNVAQELGGLVEIEFNKKQGAKTTSGHATPKDPFGKSGGAVFGFALDAAHQIRPRFSRAATSEILQPEVPCKLVAIPILWKKNRQKIIGAPIGELMPLLRRIKGN